MNLAEVKYFDWSINLWPLLAANECKMSAHKLSLVHGLCMCATIGSMAKAFLDIPTYDNCSEEWVKFSADYGTFDDDREEIFCQNLQYIKQFNEQDAADRGYFLKVGPFAAHSAEEMRKLLGWSPVNLTQKISMHANASAVILRGNDVDWRSKMGPVKNQGTCGSCWAFAAIDVVDFQTGSSHSEQQVLDCSGTGSCNGGEPLNALRYLSGVGSDPESSYPYQGARGSCQHGIAASATVSDARVVQGEPAILTALQERVVAVCITGGGALQVSLDTNILYQYIFVGISVYIRTNIYLLVSNDYKLVIYVHPS